MRALVVEDLEDLATAIGIGLRREGMAVDVVLDGHDALAHLAITRYDVVVLDRDLPGVHGDEVCRHLAAERTGSRVLMLTAAGTVKERVDGLGLGSDDICPDPSTSRSSMARVGRSAVGSTAPLPPKLQRGDVTLDPASGGKDHAGRRLEQSKGIRRAGVPALFRGQGRLDRGAAGAGLGRTRDPLHHGEERQSTGSEPSSATPPYSRPSTRGGYLIGEP